MNKKMINIIRKMKQKYEPEGFIIIGIFGSYAREEETEKSDIDILYEMKPNFYNKYHGWDVYPIINRIEKELERALGKKIDLADRNALKKVGKKYILPEVQYV
ncbi:MAG: nucleotidyltransferase domain-containing protein [Candidatus Cloacimonetes bacterium]|nr:nucleotidyltransferase domain-containing protein [Candidatus Cloacimonadota bacterium]